MTSPVSTGTKQFPCNSCGAKVVFAPGTDWLRCPYCGSTTAIPATTDGVRERPLEAAIADEIDGEAPTEEVVSVRCDSCAALVEPLPTHEAFPCPYCGSTIVARELSQRLIKPQAVLPFRIARAEATDLFRAWIKKLWFAPNELKKLANLDGRLQGLYTPYWTYDAGTITHYTGERGDQYYVTRTRTVMRDGKPHRETYQEVRVRWTPVSGTVSRTFDDVLIVGSESLPKQLATELEPWDFDNLVTYADEYLSGFTAERYQVDVHTGWEGAKVRMASVIAGDVNAAIGGDRQRIHSMNTSHRDVTYKHILLPMWICSYRYKKKVYRFLVNARTGEVQGQRPWSRVKIALVVLGVAALIVTIGIIRNM